MTKGWIGGKTGSEINYMGSVTNNINYMQVKDNAVSHKI